MPRCFLHSAVSSLYVIDDKLCPSVVSPSSYYAYTHNLEHLLSPPSICPPRVDLSIHAFSATLCYTSTLGPGPGPTILTLPM